MSNITEQMYTSEMQVKILTYDGTYPIQNNTNFGMHSVGPWFDANNGQNS